MTAGENNKDQGAGDCLKVVEWQGATREKFTIFALGVPVASFVLYLINKKDRSLKPKLLYRISIGVWTQNRDIELQKESIKKGRNDVSIVFPR